MSTIPIKVARNIVQEIGYELDYHINLMDENGIIIASTNPDRVGSQHTVAKRIVQENLNQIMIEDKDETSLVKHGVNLPIRIDDKIVGVIGITGAAKEVKNIGNIVQRMTEILLRENMEKDERYYSRRVIYRFVDKWIAEGDPSASQYLLDEGGKLGINVLIPRRCLVLDYMDSDSLIQTISGQGRLQKMDEAIRNYASKFIDVIYYHLGTKQFLFLPTMQDHEIESLFSSYASLLMRNYGENIRGGYDNQQTGTNNLKVLRSEALRALTSTNTKVRLTGYGNLSLELIYSDITTSTAQLYLDRLFHNMDQAGIEKIIHFIDLYFQNEGSVSKIAQQSYAHKNTIQNRIKRLIELTHFDIRKPSESPRFYLAKELYHQLFN